MDTMKEVEFRDGPRLVPIYLAELMTGFDTYKMTYEQAVADANRRMTADYINVRADAFVAEHFKERR